MGLGRGSLRNIERACAGLKVTCICCSMMGSTGDGQAGPGAALERRRAQYKQLHKVSVREARRLEVLKRQKEARTDRLDAARELVLRSLDGDAGSQPQVVMAVSGRNLLHPLDKLSKPERGRVFQQDGYAAAGGLVPEGPSLTADMEDGQGMAEEEEGEEAVGMECNDGEGDEEEAGAPRRDRRTGGRRRHMPLAARRDVTKYFFSQVGRPLSQSLPGKAS